MKSQTRLNKSQVVKNISSILLLLIAFSTYMQAAILCVDDDYHNATPDGSIRNPFASIQTAIMMAVDFDTIKVAAGSYGPINTMGKPLTLLGGYTGASSANYTAGMDGNFNDRSSSAAVTVISGSADTIGVNLTRFDFNPFSLVFDNFTVKNCRKGVVCDIAVSWPHVDNVTISNNIIESNGQMGLTSLGGGLLVSGNHNRIVNNIIRNNRGGRGAGISGNRFGDSILIDGNQILNNTGYDDHCGGLYLAGYVTLSHNMISGNRLENSYGWGGGVLILGTAYMSFNVIKDNYCPSYGGALFVDEGGTAYLDNELIYGNHTDQNGAAIGVDNGDPGSSHVTLTNCTIANNHGAADLGGNALYLDNGSFGTVKNCIFYGNGDDFYVLSSSVLTVSYTLSQESISGVGNISVDPLFADTSNQDYHLKSTKGRYDPTALIWVNDNVYSPAIDAGDPTSAYKTEPSPNGNRIDLGCYGNTAFASKSVIATGVNNSDVDSRIHCAVSPNPSDGLMILSIDTPIHHSLELEIRNLVGQLIHTSEIHDQSTTFHLNSAPGLYFYTLNEMGRAIASGPIVMQ